MGKPKASMKSEPDRSFSVEGPRIPSGRHAIEEENASQDQEKLVEHIIGLLRRFVATFARG